MNLIKLFVFVLVLIGSLMINSVDSECCKHACCGNFRCCGSGRCNIFCCNCNNDSRGCLSCTKTLFQTMFGVFSCVGCAKGKITSCIKCVRAGKKRRDVSYLRERTAQSIMEEADENQDGFMDVLEAAEFLAADNKLHINEVEMAKKSADYIPNWFLHMDANKDGLIALHELDSLE
ncbi:uncharacterized protein LOC100205944 [Hydra vulgaris]|uniref:uncharacterized protein LOC100205944 n=1 Tax=Hydra vulgaris TaxID=6087 RepID=UPI00019245EA|nr:uncharacterized protein LOC100205944 [Hydra vulgaris]